MSLKTLLDSIEARASSGWNRSTGKRNLMQRVEMAQDILVAGLGEKRIWRGTDNNGWVPYLLTSAGTYTYEVKAANLSSGAISLSINGSSYSATADIVRRVFIDVTQGGYDNSITWLGEPALYSDINPFSNSNERLLVSKISVETLPAMGAGNPTITFPFDPGTTTTKFFVEFYWRAPRLTSEASPLMVTTDLEQALEDYVVGYMQECENGSPSQLTTKFEDYWKPKFVEKFKSTAKINNDKVILRPC